MQFIVTITTTKSITKKPNYRSSQIYIVIYNYLDVCRSVRSLVIPGKRLIDSKFVVIFNADQFLIISKRLLAPLNHPKRFDLLQFLRSLI